MEAAGLDRLVDPCHIKVGDSGAASPAPPVAAPPRKPCEMDTYLVGKYITGMSFSWEIGICVKQDK